MAKTLALPKDQLVKQALTQMQKAWQIIRGRTGKSWP